MKVTEGGGAYYSQRAPRSSNAYINGGGVIRSHLKHLSSPFPLSFYKITHIVEFTIILPGIRFLIMGHTFRVFGFKVQSSAL